MSFWKDKRWIGVGVLAIVAAGFVVPQNVKADVVIEPDGVMGQSIVDEMTYDPAEDYALLSKSADAPAAFDLEQIPMLRATTYTDLFLEGSFTTVSALNGSTYYHDIAYEDDELFEGIDVSWWQGGGRGSKTSKINWKKMHDAGADFVFVRAGSRDTADGSIYEDTTASAHIKGAQANGMNVGLYIFSQAINTKEAVQEADFVLNLIDKYNWDIDMPIIMDREAGRATKRLTNAKLSKAKETQVVQAFVDEITGSGYKAGMYASYSWYKDKMNADDLEDCYIWLARYNFMTTSNTQQVKTKDKAGNYIKDADGNYVMTTPVPYEDVKCDYEFWQYSSTKPSSSTGYTSNLDKNFWYKDTNVQTENLTMTKNTASSITLSWDDAGDAEQYRVYRFDPQTGKYAYLKTVSDTAYTDTNLAAGTDYQYKVRCMWTIGGENYFGTYSSALTATTLPTKVTNVCVDAQTSTKISLSWDAVDGISGYRILQYQQASGTFEEVASVGADATSYDVTNLKADSIYRFKVQAYQVQGGKTRYGEISDEVSAMTKPAKVGGLSVKVRGTDSLELTWKEIEGVSGYQVYRLDTETGKYVKIATIEEASTCTYTDETLKAATAYSYKVRAYKTYENTTYYGSFSAVKKQVTKPDKMKKLKLSTKNSSITVKWGKMEGVSGYQVYRLNAKTGKYEKIATVKGNTKTSYTNKKLKKGATYSYKVRAYVSLESSEQYGGFSPVAKLKTK